MGLGAGGVPPGLGPGDGPPGGGLGDGAGDGAPAAVQMHFPVGQFGGTLLQLLLHHALVTSGETLRHVFADVRTVEPGEETLWWRRRTLASSVVSVVVVILMVVSDLWACARSVKRCEVRVRGCCGSAFFSLLPGTPPPPLASRLRDEIVFPK